MDFFHVPSFEDHFTLKIWIKNWNLKINRYLFKFIHNLNDFFNSQISQDMIPKYIDEEILEELFQNKQWRQEPMKFSLFLQKDFDDQKQLQGQFFKKMHFLIFLVQIENQTPTEIQNVHNNIKKFAYLKDNVSVMIIFFCQDDKIQLELNKIKYSTVFNSIILDKELFKTQIMPLFFRVLREKIEQSPKLESNLQQANQNYIANNKSDNFFGINEGKIFKLRGDLSLIFDSMEDGYDYYEKAQIIFDQKNINPVQNSDKLTIWQGTIKESQAALQYFQIVQALKRNNNKQDEEINLLQQELIKYSNQALKLYTKENKKDFILELILKLLGVFSLLKNKRQFIDKFFTLKNLDKVLNIDPRIYLYIGDLAHNTKLDRMAICSLFECTRKSEQVQNLKTITNECLNLSARILKIDLDSYQNNYQMLELLPKQITQAFLKKLVNLNQILGNTEKTLHYYLLIMKKFDESEDYFKKICDQILWEVPFYQHQYDILPFIQRIEPIGRPKEFRKIELDQNQSTKQIEQSVFIYDPRNKNKFLELNWVAQQESEIRVYLTNPLPIYVKIDSLSLETENVDTANYSTEITLTPYQKNFECKFKMRPVNFGLMKIKGIKIRIGNLIYFNEVNSRGIGTLYQCLKKDNPYIYQKFYEQYDINLDQIEIAESVPQIEVTPNSYFSETLFYNENIFLDLKVTNFSKLTAQNFIVFLKIDYENGAPIKISQDFDQLELDYSKFFNISLKLYQGEGGQNNQQTKLEFEKINSKFMLKFANKNLIERIYKVTLSIESKFSSNENFVSCKKFIKSFKNYKLFDVTLHLIDLFGISDLRIKDDWKFIDISDQLQFYFEIKTQFSNISTSNITIFLRNKYTKQNLQKIVLSEKNVIKFSESRKDLVQIKDLNEKYELYWEISENQRSGIIHFSYPLIFQNSFQLNFQFKDKIQINKPFEFTIQGGDQQKNCDEQNKQQFCDISLTSKNQSNNFIEGKTKFWFKNAFKKNFKAIFCEQDEYHLYVIVKDYDNKYAMIHREVIHLQLI